MNATPEIFNQYRSKLTGIAYRMLGSRADAEDVLQEAYIRWLTTEVSDLRSPEAWLVTVVMRLSIDRLRLAKKWLKEWLKGVWLKGVSFALIFFIQPFLLNIHILFVLLTCEPHLNASPRFHEVLELLLSTS